MKNIYLLIGGLSMTVQVHAQQWEWAYVTSGIGYNSVVARSDRN
jgi:heme/copper-type cytochrome/quinol oxidase subunit 2